MENREVLARSETAGCFRCKKMFDPSEVEEWTDTDSNGVGQTALCPKCGMDSVLGSASGFPINAEFLAAMENRWF